MANVVPDWVAVAAPEPSHLLGPLVPQVPAAHGTGNPPAPAGCAKPVKAIGTALTEHQNSPEARRQLIAFDLMICAP